MIEPCATCRFGSEEAAAASALIELALAEDLGDRGDITSNVLLPPDVDGSVQIVARAAGVLSGIPAGELVLSRVDPSATWDMLHEDGQPVERGTVVARLSGPVVALLSAERTILNFMTHLSGVATLTRQYVEAVKGTSASILDTRKTLPGWRVLEKYAVRCGGGTNHRMGLWDAVLIKDNHLAALAEQGRRTLAEAVQTARERVDPGTTIQIEVDSLEQLADAVRGRPDVVLLDNMTPAQLRDAVALRDCEAPHVLLEASGGVDLTTVAEIARTGIDRISVGRLTHSAPALDLAFDWR